jgi:hypothetical protein
MIELRYQLGRERARLSSLGKRTEPLRNLLEVGERPMLGFLSFSQPSEGDSDV